MCKTRNVIARSATALTCLLLAASLLAGTAAPVQAQSGGEYELTWSTVDGGGYMYSSGADYALGGTIGQLDAGELAGGDYRLAGGFWGPAPGSVPTFKIYLPLIWRAYDV